MDDQKYQDFLGHVERLAEREGLEHALSYVRGAAFFDDDPRLRLREGVLLAGLRRWKEAAGVLEAMEPLLTQEPERSVLASALARTLMPLGRAGEAVPRIESVSAAAPDTPAVELLHAQILERAGRRADAVALLRGVHERHPDDPEVTAALAQALAGAGQAEEGLALARKAVGQHPTHAASLGAVGVCLYALGRHGECLRPLEEAASLDPKTSTWPRYAGQAFMQLGDVRSAEDLLEAALRLDADDAHLHGLLSSVYTKRGKHHEAIRHALSLTRMEPDASMSWLSLALVLNEAGRVDEARDALAEALRRPPVPDWAPDLAKVIGAGPRPRA